MTKKATTAACPTSSSTEQDVSAHDDEFSLSLLSCAELCQKARALWLQMDRTLDDNMCDHLPPPPPPPPRRRIDVVEELYRHVWNRQLLAATKKQDSDSPENSEQQQQQSTSARKKMKRTTGCSCSNISSSTEATTTGSPKQKQNDCCEHWKVMAGEKLALIYLQSQRSLQADSILQILGYPCRLARCVLDYDTTKSSRLPSVVDKNNKSHEKKQHIPCCIYDHVLSPLELEILQQVFGNPNASYWTEHNYSVEPPSPYFSYILNIGNNHGTNDRMDDHGTYKDGMLYHLIQKLQILLKPHFSNITDATSVELWAHNRPTSTGHQFHFDSDNEGCTSIIRNPIVTCVLYLNGGEHEKGGGGPSIVTTQRLASRSLAESGWACPPRIGRMLALDGKVLHGVIPGKIEESPDDDDNNNNNGSNPRRRVTVMLAFWRRIRIRDQPGAAACAWPTTMSSTSSSSSSSSSLWATQLLDPVTTQDESSKQQHGPNSTTMEYVPIERVPIPLNCIYELVDTQTACTNGLSSNTEDPKAAMKPWNRRMGFPDYEQIFQGF